MGSGRLGTWNIALGETNSAANFSLAVLMNSVKRCMTALFASIVIGHPHRTWISRQHNSSQVLIVTGHESDYPSEDYWRDGFTDYASAWHD